MQTLNATTERETTESSQKSVQVEMHLHWTDWTDNNVTTSDLNENRVNHNDDEDADEANNAIKHTTLISQPVTQQANRQRNAFM